MYLGSTLKNTCSQRRWKREHWQFAKSDGTISCMREAQRTGSQSIVRGERRSRCPPSTGGRGSCGILSRRHRNCRGTHLKNSSGLRWNIQPPSSVKSSCFKALFNWRYTAAASDDSFVMGKKGVLHDGKKLDGSIMRMRREICCMTDLP